MKYIRPLFKNSCVTLALLVMSSYSPIAIPASNQDILDRLDELEWERLMDQQLKELSRPSKGYQSSASNEIKYIGDDTEGSSFMIYLSTIRKNRAGNVVFDDFSSSTRPRYKGNFVYFSAIGTIEMNCEQLTYRRTSSFFYGPNSKFIKSEKYNQNLHLIPRNSMIDAYRRFICR